MINTTKLSVEACQLHIAYNGTWGYSALMVSFANTKEPLYFKEFGANRPSHEGSADLLDRSVALVRRAGFDEVLLRGDTDYAFTANFDRWNADGVTFVFGYDARKNLVERAESTDEELYHELVRRAERQVETAPRCRPHNVKDDVVAERKFKVLRTTAEDVCEFDYRPGACRRDYRVVALRKDLSVERGDKRFCSTSTAGSSTSRTFPGPRVPTMSSWKLAGAVTKRT